MKIIGFNHFQLDSFDVEKTRKFYESLGGTVTQVMEREGSWKGYHIRLTENTTIEVQPPRLPELCGGFDGWDHMALWVSDCAKVCGMIEAAGGRIEKHPTPNNLCGMPITNAVVYGVDGEKLEIIQKEGAKENSELICGTCHMQLNCMDVHKAKDVYLQAFGGSVTGEIMTKDGSALKGFMLDIGGGSVLELQPPRFPLTGKTSSWNTIAIETDEIQAAIDQMTAAGFVLEVGPMNGSMGTQKILNAVLIGPEQEHIELIQLI